MPRQQVVKLAIALYALWLFAGAALLLQADRQARAWQASNGLLPTAAELTRLSYRRWEDMLRACDDDLVTQKAVDPQRIADCAHLAHATPSGTSVPALALLVAAGAARHRGDTTAAHAALARSQTAAPFEGWLAARRIIHLRHLPRARDALHGWALADLQLLAGARRFHDVLHETYRGRVDLRTWIAAALPAATGEGAP